MRETSSTFDKGFQVGLPPYTNYYTQGEFLTECYNMVPGSMGLEERKEVYEPETFLAHEGWPFPALYHLSRHSYIFTDTQLFYLAKDGSVDMLWEQPGGWGGLPHVADFQEFVVFAFPNIELTLRWGKEICFELYEAHFRTCCNFRGQLVIGDCELPKGPTNNCCGEPSYTVEVGGENVAAWSKIGQVDWEYNLGNEVGWAPMPWQGKVLAVLPLDKEVVVYGSNGVAKLSPQEQPTVTFGVRDFGDVGLLGRDCVAGSLTRHLFIGTDYNLYYVEPERALTTEGKQPKRLGYAHLVQNLVRPLVTYDSINQQWWIGDSERCFVFSGTGLGEANITPTHLNGLDGLNWAYCYTHGKDEAIVQTSPLSLGSRGIKTLMNVEADLLATEQVWGQASWRTHYREPYKFNRPILLDPRGSFFPVTAGTEVRVRFTTPQFRGFNLTKLWLHFKNTDKTFSRGVINAGRPPE